MHEGLSAAFPARLRVQGTVVVFQQRISLRLFVGGGISLIAVGLLWVAGLPWQLAVTLLAVAAAVLFLTFELSWAGRSVPRWAVLAWRAVTAPRVLLLQPERVALTAVTTAVTPLPVRWADGVGTPRISSVERRRDALQ